MAPVIVPADYEPSEDETYMNPVMLEFFRQKLVDWKRELLSESSDTLATLASGGLQEPDITDRASLETDAALELRTRDRYRKLLSKIDEAMQRVEEGEYGYCEETGEPIGVKRLIARPVATLSLEAQERHERREKVQRED